MLVGVQTDAHFIYDVTSSFLVALQIPYYDEGGLKKNLCGSEYSLRDRYDCSGNKGYYCIERGYNMFCGRRALAFYLWFQELERSHLLFNADALGSIDEGTQKAE